MTRRAAGPRIWTGAYSQAIGLVPLVYPWYAVPSGVSALLLSTRMPPVVEKYAYFSTVGSASKKLDMSLINVTSSACAPLPANSVTQTLDTNV
jgi:hypothetical protein